MAGRFMESSVGPRLTCPMTDAVDCLVDRLVIVERPDAPLDDKACIALLPETRAPRPRSSPERVAEPLIAPPVGEVTTLGCLSSDGFERERNIKGGSTRAETEGAEHRRGDGAVQQAQPALRSPGRRRCPRRPSQPVMTRIVSRPDESDLTCDRLRRVCT